MFAHVLLLVVIMLLLVAKSLSTARLPEQLVTSPKPKLVWFVHMYPPYNNAGAEWTAHCLNRYLVSKHSYNISVFMPGQYAKSTKCYKGLKNITRSLDFNERLANNTKPITIYDDVPIYSYDNIDLARQLAASASAICGHLDCSEKVRNLAKMFNKPYIHFLHNSHEYERLSKWTVDKHPTYFVANSEWIKAYYRSLFVPTMVINPPVDWRYYHVHTNKKWVTLINLNKNKGGGFLIKLALRMPQVKFAGVIGGYSKQVVNKNVKNITYINNTSDIREIYKSTAVLLVPSIYESWGRVAVEAMSSGIPVIANSTPGLKECISEYGIFCSRENIDEWVAALNKLMTNTEYYTMISQRAFKRAKQLDPNIQMDAFVNWHKNTVQTAT